MPYDRGDNLFRAMGLVFLLLAGTEAHAASVTVDFDHLNDGTPITAPATFAATTPLREQLSGQGVHFTGGGGVLSGNFGVGGTSGRNFLAFNARLSARYADGSAAAPPEQIRFDQPTDLVRLSVGSAEVGTATLTALDAAGNPVGSAQRPLTPLTTPLEVQSTSYNIVAITLGVTGARSVVADDLVFLVPDHNNVPPVTRCALSGPSGANGWFIGDVQATLTATDADGTVASTRYRLDGGAWQPYTTPVVVTGDGTHTIEFQSSDNEGAWEEVKTENLQIDATRPVVQLELSNWLLYPPNHKLIPVTVNGSATDGTSGVANVTFQVKDEYATVQPTLTGFGQTILLQAARKGSDRDGRHYWVTVTVTDKAGNVSNASRVVLVPHNWRRLWRNERRLNSHESVAEHH
jgi:hypothetical protein